MITQLNRDREIESWISDQAGVPAPGSRVGLDAHCLRPISLPFQGWNKHSLGREVFPVPGEPLTPDGTARLTLSLRTLLGPREC